jgi:hypothetical protein
MSDQNVKGKSKYESPVLIPLGEMAKGSGVCVTGSSVVAPSCIPGAADSAVIDCTAGSQATRDCTAGTNATRDCTAGVNATRGCTSGGLIA